MGVQGALKVPSVSGKSAGLAPEIILPKAFTRICARLERYLRRRLCVRVLYRLEFLRENRRLLGDGVGLGAAVPHRRQRRRCIANLWPLFGAGCLSAAVRRTKRKGIRHGRL